MGKLTTFRLGHWNTSYVSHYQRVILERCWASVICSMVQCESFSLILEVRSQSYSCSWTLVWKDCVTTHLKNNDTSWHHGYPLAMTVTVCYCFFLAQSKCREFSPEEYMLLVGGDWNMTFIFPCTGNVIIPIDEVIFFRGVGIPPTRLDLSIVFFGKGWPQRLHCQSGVLEDSVVFLLGSSSFRGWRPWWVRPSTAWFIPPSSPSRWTQTPADYPHLRWPATHCTP